MKGRLPIRLPRILLLMIAVSWHARVWADEPATPLTKFDVGSEKKINNAAPWIQFTPDGKHLAVSHAHLHVSAALTIHKVTDGQEVARVATGREDQLLFTPDHGAVSPDGKWAALVAGRKLRFLAIPPHKLAIPAGGTIDLGVTPVGSDCTRVWADAKGQGVYLSKVGLDHFELFRYGFEENPVKSLLKIVPPADSGLVATALDPQANRLAVVFQPRRSEQPNGIECWSLGDKPVKTMLEGSMYMSTIQFSPDGKILFVGHNDGSVIWHDTVTGKKIDRQPLGQYTVTSLAFHPKGTHVACATLDPKGAKNLFVIQLNPVQVTAQFVADKDGVSAACFSHDGTRLATYGGYGGIAIWDTKMLLGDVKK